MRCIHQRIAKGGRVDLQSIFGGVSLVGVTAAVTWFGQAWSYQRNERKEALSRGDRLAEHQDSLTIQLLSGAREEMVAARNEIEVLRDEVHTLRGLEQHMFHFQQSLDHLQALLVAGSDGEREVAERNARAFLNRMKRLQEAKGVIRNEAQTIASEVHAVERELGDKDDD